MCAALERLVTGAQPASLLGLTWALSTTLSRCPGACCAVCCVLCDGAGVALQRDWCAGCCCPSQGPDSPHAAGPGQLPYRAPRQPAAGSPAGTCRGCCPRPVRPGQPLLVKGGRGTGCVLAAVVTRERERSARCLCGCHVAEGLVGAFWVGSSILAAACVLLWLA